MACRLETGRTHQIRVHLRAIGHPVVGDPTYDGDRPLLGARLGRPFLHAELLAFTHPETGERVEFSDPLPPDLAAVLARLDAAEIAPVASSRRRGPSGPGSTRSARVKSSSRPRIRSETWTQTSCRAQWPSRWSWASTQFSMGPSVAATMSARVISSGGRAST